MEQGSTLGNISDLKEKGGENRRKSTLQPLLHSNYNEAKARDSSRKSASRRTERDKKKRAS
jgi:hypothetical protein